MKDLPEADDPRDDPHKIAVGIALGAAVAVFVFVVAATCIIGVQIYELAVYAQRAFCRTCRFARGSNRFDCAGDFSATDRRTDQREGTRLRIRWSRRPGDHVDIVVSVDGLCDRSGLVTAGRNMHGQGWRGLPDGV
jgi:hypothetical protein